MDISTAITVFILEILAFAYFFVCYRSEMRMKIKDLERRLAEQKETTLSNRYGRYIPSSAIDDRRRNFSSDWESSSSCDGSNS